jgi:hypothetical protein
LTHETPIKKPEEEPIFFTDEQGNPIESEGSFFANVSVKRRNNKEHFTFSKAEPTLENQVLATGGEINDVIIPVSEEKPKPVEIESDTRQAKASALASGANKGYPADDIFGDNNNVHESYQPFQDQEITNTGLQPEPEPEPVKEPINNKRDAFLKQIEEEDKIRKEIKYLANEYESLKVAFSKNPNERISKEEWAQFKALAKAINYDMKKTSNRKQNKDLLLKKLIELEPILKAEIERKEQEIRTKNEDAKTRYPPESKGTFQTIQDYAAPVIAGAVGVAGAVGGGIYSLKKATDIPPSFVNGVVNTAASLMNNPGVQTAVDVGRIYLPPKVTSPYPEQNDLGGMFSPMKAGSRRAKKKGTPSKRNNDL